MVFILGACAEKPPARAVNSSDPTQEVIVLNDHTKLVLQNAPTPIAYEVKPKETLSAVIARGNLNGIQCEANLIIPSTKKNQVISQAHKEVFDFKNKQIIEERRTQTEIPFYTNRFKFFYTFRQKNPNPGENRREIAVSCQTDFASVQPAMDLTIKEINEIFKKKTIEVKNKIADEDNKDI
jgi:hypothetical protein